MLGVVVQHRDGAMPSKSSAQVLKPQTRDRAHLAKRAMRRRSEHPKFGYRLRTQR